MKFLAIAAAMTFAGSANAAVIGEFYDLDATFADIQTAQAYTAANTADATFNVSTINYPGDRVYPASETNLYRSQGPLDGFLGDDASTLSDPAEASTALTHSLFKFSGQIGVDSGTNDLEIELDDKYALYIDGSLIQFSNAIVARRVIPISFDGGAGGLLPFELYYFENGGSAFVQFAVNGSFVTSVPPSAAVPLPAALPLLAGGLAVAGLIGRRRKT